MPDIHVDFGTRYSFGEAALVIWTAVQTGLSPEEVIDFCEGQSLILNAESLSATDRVRAFEYLAGTDRTRLKVFSRVEAAQKEGPRDALMLCVLVNCIVFHGLTKTAAIAMVAEFQAKAKSMHREDPYLKHLFGVASDRYIEAAWSKYRSVLHYSETRAVIALRPFPPNDFFNPFFKDFSNSELEQRSMHILSTLREKGLMDKALIANRGSV